LQEASQLKQAERSKGFASNCEIEEMPLIAVGENAQVETSLREVAFKLFYRRLMSTAYRNKIPYR